MASYILRQIDPELWKRVKMRALSEDVSVRAVIDTLLREWLASPALDKGK